MIVKEVPLLDDNYGYLLVGEATKEAAAIDAVEPSKVLKEAEALGVNISMVLTTHKHWDHASGNSGMAKHLPGIPIVGGAIDNVEACTRRVNDGEHFMLGASVKITCLHTPGHTLGHICYVADDGQDRAVFTGDTLFIGGAGKFFEGTPADMYHSLYDKLAKLPGDTKVYCGHEYTMSNYKFALSIDKNNAELARAAEEAQALRAQGRPTVPSTIDKELATNPFMRVDQQAIKAAVPGSKSMSPEEILGAVREMKDRFR